MHRGVEDHEWHARLEELAEPPFVVLRGNRQQSGDAFGAKRVEIDPLAVGGAIGVGQQRQQPNLVTSSLIPRTMAVKNRN